MKRLLSLAVLFWGLAFICFAWSEAPSRGISAVAVNGGEIPLYAKSYALIVGNGDYSNGWDPLPGAVKDAGEIAGALEKLGFEVQLETNVNRVQFTRAFRKFALSRGKNKDSRLLFYYAGHGHTIPLATDEEMGYLVMTDAPPPDSDPLGFDEKAVDMQFMVTQAKKIRARHTLFMFDSCFSGTILNLRENVKPKTISDNVKHPVRQFITAGRANEPVPDYSVFKQCFLDLIEGRDSEPFEDGYITGEELGFYLKNKVPAYNSNQHPQFGKINDPKLDKGDFIFASVWSPGSNHKTAPPKPDLPPKQGAASFDDIMKAEEVQRREIQTWRSWQEAREDELTKVTGLDASDFLKPVQKKQAWERFLSAVSRDNPHSSKDDDMRSQARARIKHWEDKSLLAMSKAAEKPAQDFSAESLGMNFIYIKPGTFSMGSPYNEPGRRDDEKQHRVTLTKGFYMQSTETTQAQWKAVMGENPSRFKGDDNPVENVSWDDVQDFIGFLNKKEGEGKYRLPTEAEWEYACRAGGRGLFSFGDSISGLGEYAWCGSNSMQKTHPVAGKRPNAWGLYDMHGNVWEWCQDRKGPYPSGSAVDPKGPESGSLRVFRGGGYYFIPAFCRSAFRNAFGPDFNSDFIGFRLVKTR